MQNSTWVYYRLFLKEPGNFSHFTSLLNDVISPAIEQFSDNILHFHFFFYGGAYKHHLEGNNGVLDRLPDVHDDDQIQFIRLRIQTRSEREQEIRNTILSLAAQSSAVHGYEVPTTPYNVVEDIGGRFGKERTKLVMDLLEATARLSLDYAKGKDPFDPHPQNQGGSRGLVHLVSNTLQYQITVLTDANIWFRVWGTNLGGDYPANTQLL